MGLSGLSKRLRLQRGRFIPFDQFSIFSIRIFMAVAVQGPLEVGQGRGVPALPYPPLPGYGHIDGHLGGIDPPILNHMVEGLPDFAVIGQIRQGSSYA